MPRLKPSCLGLVLILVLGANFQAFSKDLNILVRILYASFLAEQGAAMCVVPSVGLSDDDRQIFSDAKSYSHWIKQRIIADLKPDEVHFILRSAADKARGEMREVISVIKSHPPAHEAAELTRWCRDTMKRIASQVVSTYVNQRDKVDRLIETSKRD